MSEHCPVCHKEFESLGHHWRWNKEHRPEIIDHQMEVAKGLLMGDGCLTGRQNQNHTSSGQNPSLVVRMITPEYLRHLDGIFGHLSRGVILEDTGEENARNLKEGLGVEYEDCKDIYRWYTCSHPDFLPLSAWYDSGKKVWPEYVNLTPTVLKHWYAGDGSLADGGAITIAMSNEEGNESKIESYFTSAGLPAPNNWQTHERSGERSGVTHRAVWNVSEAKELLEYMGCPPPGFEYKWDI